MPVIEAIAPTPIKMCFFEPAAEAQGSREIYQRGVATTRDGIVVDGIPQAPKSETITVQTAKEHSFGFEEIYMRKAGASTVGCVTMWLAGFDGTNSQLQRKAGTAILEGIVGPNVQIVSYGDHKRVAFLRTHGDASTMIRRSLDIQEDLIGAYFSGYAQAQEKLTKERYARLVEKTPFDDIVEGKVDALKKPFEDDSDNPESNNNYYFTWGYQQEGEELFAISPDNIKYSMSMLIATSPTRDTAKMMQDINDFMQGDDEEDRVVVQIDWAEDASCINTSVNAQQSSFMSDSITSFITNESILQNISSFSYIPFDIFKSKNNCQKCQKNKNDGCSCEKESKPLAA